MLAGVLLAAGASKRMGAPKSLKEQGGMSYLARGVRTLWHGCTSVITVLGSQAPVVRRAAEEEFARLMATGKLLPEMKSARRKGAEELELHFSVNPRWRSGMLSSARAGLTEALELEPEAILVLPVDHPFVSPATVLSLAKVSQLALAACRNAAERRTFSYALIPRHRHHRGHPLAVTKALAKAIVSDKDAVDLSDAVRRHARLVGYLDVADAGVTRNVNRPGD